MSDFNHEEFITRLNDETYAKAIASRIDDFFKLNRAVKIVDVVQDSQTRDMVEVVMQHALDLPKGNDVALGFILGVYLANKNLAILPTNLN